MVLLVNDGGQGPLRLSGAHHIHAFSAAMTPALHVASGAAVVLETLDALSGKVTRERCEPVGPEDVNPATGPIYVEGARAGDGLRVHILDLRPVGTGFAGAGQGALGGRVRESVLLFFDTSLGELALPGGVRVPLRPHVGVVGVAPAAGAGEVHNQYPGDHGGNMDCNLVRAGSAVTFGVRVAGAMLALGDVHARMGDGELNGQGVEVASEIRIRVELVPGGFVPRPRVETAELRAAVASAPTLDEAVATATADMVEWLEDESGLSAGDALILLGLAAEVRVCQVVNPLKTARIELPRGCWPGCGPPQRRA